jgi:hypothetical protein
MLHLKHIRILNSGQSKAPRDLAEHVQIPRPEENADLSQDLQFGEDEPRQESGVLIGRSLYLLSSLSHEFKSASPFQGEPCLNQFNIPSARLPEYSSCPKGQPAFKID